MILGRILMLTIREHVHIPIEDMREIWERHGLDLSQLPAPRSPEDAFRNATPRKRWTNDFALMDYKGPLRLSPTSSLETVLVLSTDSSKKVDIDHTNRAIIWLDDRESVGVKPLTPLSQQEVEYITTIKNTFSDARVKYDGGQVRVALYRALATCHSLIYRDGCYLIPAQEFSTADAIRGIVRDLQPYTNGKANICWDIPYVDSDDTRKQIQLALTMHIEKVTDDVYREAQTLKPRESRRRKGVDRHDTLHTKLSDVRETITAYERLLGISLEQHRTTLNGYIEGIPY